ncbi:MAG: hypothetical protein P4L87_22025, partial [Formivibrio sp.]|nr:hypothetical protein [Formivibrio sp.]
LKRLDRQREKQVRRMDQAPIVYSQGISSRHRGKDRRPLPVGLPFSYFGQFRNYEGRRLINNPYRSWFQRFISHPIFAAFHYPPKMLRRLKGIRRTIR